MHRSSTQKSSTHIGQARSLLVGRAPCFWIAFNTAGLLLDCFQLRSLAFGLLPATPACFWIAFIPGGLDWIWIVSWIGVLLTDCSRKREVFSFRTEPSGHVSLAVHVQATRLCTITPQQALVLCLLRPSAMLLGGGYRIIYI